MARPFFNSPTLPKDDDMADAEDVANVIQSALGEIGMTGDLVVAKDGQKSTKQLGERNGQDVTVDVVVDDLGTEKA